jgi:hypothetical protein
VRVTRGLFGALGASGSLVAGGACLLLLASAVIAFRGWPSVPEVGGDARSLVVSSDRDREASGASPGRPRSGAAPAVAPIVAGGPTPHVGPRTRAARPHTAAAPARGGRSASSAVAPAPAATASTSAAKPAAATPSTAGTVVRRGTSDAGRAVEQAGQSIPAGPQVTTPAGDAVTQTGDTAAKAVDGLLGGQK